ncbi:MAG TPA: 1,2-phenylacetyl-CoA epoxidase subunit PaaC [Gemmatimonadaceae bacterium]|nr:1,2-phenylacetyl-CoA epoxidase subunit PaaC [Gemmatimonadaceae bacterium]
MRLADDRLVLGHRLSEWCGHAPILEEDIALANIALDLIGQANLFYGLAGDPDQLAYLRDAIDYQNALIVELPKGDFAFTIIRQFLFSAAALYQMEALSRSTNADLGGIAAKATKETRYHVRHAGDWVLKLGDGTDESHRRAQDALNALWRYTGELFLMDAVDETLIAERVVPRLDPAPWRETVTDVIHRATLTVPDDGYMQRGGRQGRHTEALGHLLSEMQILQRSHPGAKW